MEQVGRNDPCPCGSGKKYKKCCLEKEAVSNYTTADRDNLQRKLDSLIYEELQEESREARGEFWGEFGDELKELGEGYAMMSEDTFKAWFLYDRLEENGKAAVEWLLEEATLSPPERRYLQRMLRSTMRLYQVVDVRPGVSLQLMDVLTGDKVTVHERSASRSITRFSKLAIRVNAMGASGQPEIDGGCLHMADLYVEPIEEELKKRWTRFRKKAPHADAALFYKEMTPFFHDQWLSTILNPPIPTMLGPDGEPILITKTVFVVPDVEAVTADLSATFRRDEDGWHWMESAADDRPRPLGMIRVAEGRLTLETMSKASGERGRQLLEHTLGDRIRYVTTSYEDPAHDLRKKIRSGELAGSESKPKRAEPQDIPPEVAEQVVLEHYAQHYRKWVDEPVPALDGKTPRQAAEIAEMRPSVARLIEGLHSQYERALKHGQPAYDPSWMWAELGLAEDRIAYPPPLAHERLAKVVKGLGPLTQQIADVARKQSGFDDRSSLVSRELLNAHLPFRRFLEDLAIEHHRQGATEDAAAFEANLVGTHAEWMSNFELHRRKVFWVDEALVFQLSNTDLDVPGAALRAPFPCFALVFTDRHFLGLAERLLSIDGDAALSGQILRVATVIVMEEVIASRRVLRVCFNFDALAAEQPYLISRDLPIDDDAPLLSALDAHLSDVNTSTLDPIFTSAHTKAMLKLVFSSVLFATSAGVEPLERHPPEKPERRSKGPKTSGHSSDNVYFLPGTIDIRQLRQMQELDRAPSGRELMKRYLVRGHWRRAAASWSDQRLRWIEPYWKGPEMAVVIEKAYRLRS